MKEVKEFHQTGMLSVENLRLLELDHSCVDVGLQVSSDGRIWLCVNGEAFIRFKPQEKMKDDRG